MIIKIDNYKIKHQLNTEIFLDRDNLIKYETKPIMKLNLQLIQYPRMKKKTDLKKLILPDPQTKSTSQIYPWNL
jgi:hypothetical protein